jgi:hypothetical protein
VRKPDPFRSIHVAVAAHARQQPAVRRLLEVMREASAKVR